jgi:hypothetical protein
MQKYNSSKGCDGLGLHIKIHKSKRGGHNHLRRKLSLKLHCMQKSKELENSDWIFA